jgi:nucleoside-diphosphate-sugar epimerase
LTEVKSTKEVILVTGATGLIGGHVVERLLRGNAELSVVAVARRPERVETHGGRVSALRGDLCLPGLGVDEDVQALLAERVTGILHCAADIRFDLPLEEARQINVEGTRTLLELGRRCARLEKFAHISTTYVSGRSPELLPEGRFENRHGFFSSYQETKYEAEHLAQEYGRELPVAVYRLSTVIGNSRTGWVEQYNHFHQLLRLVQHNPLPVLPGSETARVDFVASDWVAEAVAWFYANRFRAGEVRNFAAGPEETLPLTTAMEMAFRELGRGRAPRLVDCEFFNRYIGDRMGKGDGRVAQLLQALAYLLPYFSLQQRFDSRETTEILEREAGLRRVESSRLYGLVLGHMKSERVAVAVG